MHHRNADEKVIHDFGAEWTRLDQSALSVEVQLDVFDDYFHIFPWDSLTSSSIGADVGCGSGRWASLVAPRVGHLHLADPSKDALYVARQNLLERRMFRFIRSR